MDEPIYSILPPKPDVCQECAVDHKPEDPHDQKSLFYQMYFRAKYGRSPTWEDAMKHCSEGTKKLWRKELVKAGEKLS